MSTFSLNLAGSGLEVVCRHAEIERAIRAMWAPALSLPCPSMELRIEIDAAGRLSLDGELLYDDSNIGQRPMQFESILIQTLLGRRTGALHLHAGCVLFDKFACLFVGDSGAGKSTFTKLAVKHGARYLSDDSILIERGMAHGLARTIQFDAIDLAEPVPSYHLDCDLTTYRASLTGDLSMSSWVVPLYHGAFQAVEGLATHRYPWVVAAISQDVTNSVEALSSIERLATLHSATITIGLDYTDQLGFAPTFAVKWADPETAFTQLLEAVDGIE